MIEKRKLRGDKDAVSPVIAVILMVAITVVLAAVLYVMVGNLISPDDNRPPAGNMSGDYVSATSHALSFTSLSPTTGWEEVRLRLTNKTTGSSDSVIWSFEQVGGVMVGTVHSGSDDFGGTTITIDVDEVAGNRQINLGDSVTIAGLFPGGTYEAKLFHIETGGVISELEISK